MIKKHNIVASTTAISQSLGSGRHLRGSVPNIMTKDFVSCWKYATALKALGLASAKIYSVISADSRIADTVCGLE